MQYLIDKWSFILISLISFFILWLTGIIFREQITTVNGIEFVDLSFEEIRLNPQKSVSVLAVLNRKETYFCTHFRAFSWGILLIISSTPIRWMAVPAHGIDLRFFCGTGCTEGVPTEKTPWAFLLEARDAISGRSSGCQFRRKAEVN